MRGGVMNAQGFADALFDRMAATLWVIAVLSNLTVVHRMIYTWQECKKMEGATAPLGGAGGAACP